MSEASKILIVEDDRDTAEAMRVSLEAQGYHVTTSADVEEGFRKAAEIVPDVVVLDVKMPGMDGIETIREMKKKNPYTEVILLTGHASMESGIEGMKLGAFDYIMKPVNIDELLEKIRQAYERKLIHQGTP